MLYTHYDECRIRVESARLVSAYITVICHLDEMHQQFGARENAPTQSVAC